MGGDWSLLLERIFAGKKVGVLCLLQGEKAEEIHEILIGAAWMLRYSSQSQILFSNSRSLRRCSALDHFQCWDFVDDERRRR
jgi:hypothetical protein